MYLEDLDVHALGIKKVEAVSSPKRCWVSTNYHLEDIPRCNDPCRWD